MDSPAQVSITVQAGGVTALSTHADLPTPLAALTAIARQQNGVFTLAQARACQVDEQVIAHLLRTRQWLPQRRGVYVERAVFARCSEDPTLLQVLSVQAFLLAHRGDLVASHTSAAALHRLPLLRSYGSKPVLTLHRPDAAPPARPGDRLASSVPIAQRTRAFGLPVTNRPRTVADLARTLRWEAGVVMADGALRAGVQRGEVQGLLNGPCHQWPGNNRARAVLDFADPRAESALESRARCWFAAMGLPAPELQVQIFDEHRRFVARVDFLLEGRTICEVDGRLKYDDSSALWAEKQREDRLRELGFEVVRGYWSDGADLTRLAGDLQRAFVRSALNPAPLRPLRCAALVRPLRCAALVRPLRCAAGRAGPVSATSLPVATVSGP